MQEDLTQAELEKRAAANDVPAMLELAARYINGYEDSAVTIERAPEKGVPLLEQAAAQGNAEAQCALGTLHEFGWGVAPDMQRALDLYKKAFDNGDAEACFRLGRLFDLGDAVDFNEEHAASFYEEGARRGNGDCQYYLALRSLEGRGLPRDSIRALDLLEQAGQNGVPSAFEVLGTIYLEGITVPRDAEMAFDCFSRALLYFDSDPFIAAGDTVIYFAMCLLLGVGCEKDRETAVRALEAAMEDGNLIAKQVLEEKRIKNPLIPIYFGHDADADFEKTGSVDWDISALLA
jgi:TPR repeat protein